MDFQRIAGSVDTERLRSTHVTVVGGSIWLIEGLVRCGVSGVTLVDFDRFSPTNIPRQDAYQDEVGVLKVQALAKRLRRVNPEIEIEVQPTDFCSIRREDFDAIFGQTNLIVCAADKFPPHARGNLEAIRLGKPAIWIGLHAQGRAGEIVYYVPGVTPACYRCIVSVRRGASAA